jgi:hypothetical protein
MGENTKDYLNKKTLEQLRDKYFDEYAKELQLFREFPKEIQWRIYFEYWFLLKKITGQKITINQYIEERESVMIPKKVLFTIDMMSHVNSNGCISIFSPSKTLCPNYTI